METFQIIVYLLCIITSFTCMVLLLRAYAQKRVRLLLWSGLCFVGLTVNNVILFFDLVIFPDMFLYPFRIGATIAGLLCLIYGFIWETEK